MANQHDLVDRISGRVFLCGLNAPQPEAKGRVHVWTQHIHEYANNTGTSANVTNFTSGRFRIFDVVFRLWRQNGRWRSTRRSWGPSRRPRGGAASIRARAPFSFAAEAWFLGTAWRYDGIREDSGTGRRRISKVMAMHSDSTVNVMPARSALLSHDWSSADE